MSDVMLLGVLRMPLPNDPAKISPLEWVQFRARAREAANRIEADAESIAKLRAFAQGVMEAWPIGDVDGGTLQDLAFQHGLIVPENRTEPCGENCTCAEYWSAAEWANGQQCYRRTALLKGA